jgi:hypothetical protein
MGESVLRVSPASRLIRTLCGTILVGLGALVDAPLVGEVRTSALEVSRLIMTLFVPTRLKVGPTMEVAGSAGSGLDLAATDVL